MLLGRRREGREVVPSLIVAYFRYVPQTVKDIITAGNLSWLAELRNVSVLFIAPKIDGNGTKFLESLNNFFVVTSNVIMNLEGMIRQFCIGMKNMQKYAMLGY